MTKPYSNLYKILSDFIASYFSDRDSFPELSLVPNDDALFPKINKKKGEIQYSYRTELLFILNNCGNNDLLLNYYFCVTSYTNGNYKESRYFASNIRELLKSDTIVKSLSDKYILNKDKLIYELFFVILHEFGHGYMDFSKENRDQFLMFIEEEINDLIDYYKEAFSFIKLEKDDAILPFLNEDQQHSFSALKEGNTDFSSDFCVNFINEFKNHIEKDKKKEELACDYFALSHMLNNINLQKIDYNSCPELFPACIHVIQFVQKHIWLNNYIVQQQGSEKYKIVSSLDQVRTLFLFLICQKILVEDYPDVYDYLVDDAWSGIPANQFDDDLRFLEEHKKAIEGMSKGADSIDEKEKYETNELIIDAEDDILSLIQNL